MLRSIFSRQRLWRARAIVREASMIPAVAVSGWVYAAKSAAQTEPLGVRVIEVAPDVSRHAKLDDRMQYIAYVPLGSIDRGRDIARRGAEGIATACISCHGVMLRGQDVAPPIAGRSPTYVVRQLVAFQTLRRNGAASAPMRPIVEG
jgi:cytochrome c553